MGNNSTTKMY